MKKLIYTVLFAIVASVAVSACTEESIRPQTDGSGDKCQFDCE